MVMAGPQKVCATSTSSAARRHPGHETEMEAESLSGTLDAILTSAPASSRANAALGSTLAEHTPL